jgi:UDP-2,4-diacetamido-2,4,6-trideoxy-beta-L-altropyranose hydrolase
MGRPGPLTAGHRRAEVTLRRATEDDSGLLLDWRNDPVAIRFSVSGRGVAPAEHREWLMGRLADPGTRLWIAEQAGTTVGQVRVDMDAGIGTVSVAVAPSQRGRGLGSAVLQAMVTAMESEPGVRRLRALAHAENTASIRAFERVGFHREGLHEPDFIVLERALGQNGDAGA